MQVELPISARSSSTTPYSITTGKYCDIEPFTLVQKCKHRRDSNISGTSAHLIVTPPQHGLTVLLKPNDTRTLITTRNSLKVHDKLESIHPAGVISVRPTPMFNLLALDTRNSERTKSFFALTCLGTIQAYAPSSNIGASLSRIARWCHL